MRDALSVRVKRPVGQNFRKPSSNGMSFNCIAVSACRAPDIMCSALCNDPLEIVLIKSLSLWYRSAAVQAWEKKNSSYKTLNKKCSVPLRILLCWKTLAKEDHIF